MPTKMFLKEKFKPSGAFDKLKSRLVAGGHHQDRSLYRDSCVFAIATIAHHERRAVATVDFPDGLLEELKVKFGDINSEGCKIILE